MGDYGFKVSKEGVDVRTATIKEQIINSDKNTIKIFKEGGFNKSIPADPGAAISETVAHNLNFIPAFLSYAKLSNALKAHMPYTIDFDNSLQQTWILDSDSTNLNFIIERAFASMTAKVYYFILGNEILSSSDKTIYSPTRDYGIKIARPDVDVRTAGDLELQFTSKYDTLKPFLFGSGTVAGGTLQINHNLDYYPAFLFFTHLPTEISSWPHGKLYLAPFTFGIGGDFSIIPWVTTTKLEVRFGSSIGDPLPYKYVIFSNELKFG